ncbi:hypothetical protein C4564_04425 [Candidatus Microgenomates bacterium]|nr:MAG: hypothetical protein C4564_04425 [Candidatus Microgenomates bacterium]
MKKFIGEWAPSIVALITIALFSFGLRLVNLTKLPVFADEAIYVRWAQVMKAEPTLRFLPLSDGKPPLYMWILMPFLKFISDPLFAGRFVSVLAGVGTLAGVSILSYILFRSKKSAIMAALIYAVSSYTFFFDRMALVDSLLSMLCIWIIIFSALLAKHRSLNVSMFMGFVLGAALLTKAPALFFTILIPSSAFLVKFKNKGNARAFLLLKLTGYWAVAWGIGYGMYNALRLGPNFHLLSSRNYDYVYPVSHMLLSPLDPFLPYFDRAVEWIRLLGPSSLLLLSGLAAVFHFRKYSKEVIFLLLWSFFPMLAQAEFAKVFTARYILFTIPPLIVLASMAFADAKNKTVNKAGFAIFGLGAAYSLWVNLLLITKPVQAPLPSSEHSGYFSEWTAGDGIYETSLLVRQLLTDYPDKHIVIGTEGYFGTLPDGLQMYLEGEKRVTIFGMGLGIGEVVSSLVESKNAGNITLLVANSSRLLIREEQFSEHGLRVLYKTLKEPRQKDTHEFLNFGPVDTYYVLEVVEVIDKKTLE